MSNNQTHNNNGLSGATLPLIVFLVISLGICFWYSTEDQNGLLHNIQGAFAAITSPVASASVSVDNSVNETVDSAEDAAMTEETRAELLAEIASLRAQLAQAEEYKLKAQHLEDLLYISDVYDIDGAIGNVIARSSEAYNRTITLNVGTKDGVQAGLSVSGGNGVIGQVVRVSDSTCVVRLISDSQSGVAVMIQSNRKEGIVKGSLDGLLYLENVDSEVVVQVGDVVVTSGMGGSYVRGLIVGRVVKVVEASGAESRMIIVEPNDDPSTVESAIVIKSMGSLGAAA